jgi:hypothetical protein
LTRTDPTGGDESEVDVEGLSKVAHRRTDEWVDVRNWELFPAYVGVSSEGEDEKDPEKVGAGLLALCSREQAGKDGARGKEVDGEWCAAWADTLCRLAQIGDSTAQSSSAPTMDRHIPAAVSSFDGNFGILRRMTRPRPRIEW